jgi:hypothetical protein
MDVVGPAVSVELVAVGLGLRAGTGSQRRLRGALGGKVRAPVEVVEVLDPVILDPVILDPVILDPVILDPVILDRMRVPAALALGQHRLERVFLPDDAGEFRERIVPRRRTD